MTASDGTFDASGERRAEVRTAVEKAEAWLVRVPRTLHGGDEGDRLRMVVDHLRAHGYPAQAPPPPPADPPAPAPVPAPAPAPTEDPPAPGTAAAPG